MIDCTNHWKLMGSLLDRELFDMFVDPVVE